MYAESGKLIIHKGYFNLEEFLEAYEPHKSKQTVLHFRIKTHGLINAENCHPYSIDNNLAFVHNGIIHGVDHTPDDTKSDTWHFNENYLKPLRAKDKSFFKEPAQKKLIEKFLGGSKLIFLNSKGEYEIYNENLGNWNSGCWFSNYSWKPSRLYGGYNYEDEGLCKITHLPAKITQKDKDILTAGDTCVFLFDNGQFKSGDYCKVNYLYGNNMAQVSDAVWPNYKQGVSVFSLQKTSIKFDSRVTIDQPKEESKEPTFHFQIGSEAIFISNWNHFRLHDEVKIERIFENKILCISFDTNKKYMVPKEKIEPVEKYLHILDKKDAQDATT